MKAQIAFVGKHSIGGEDNVTVIQLHVRNQDAAGLEAGQWLAVDVEPVAPEGPEYFAGGEAAPQ